MNEDTSDLNAIIRVYCRPVLLNSGNAYGPTKMFLMRIEGDRVTLPECSHKRAMEVVEGMNLGDSSIWTTTGFEEVTHSLLSSLITAYFVIDFHSFEVKPVDKAMVLAASQL